MDIDNDHDYDMFIGESGGVINFYRNDGNTINPNWVLVTNEYILPTIDVGRDSSPAFTDIDNDGDYDMFIGRMNGGLIHYRNDGNESCPNWTLVTENYMSNMGQMDFVDIDNDNDDDLFCGYDGQLYFYRNDGTPEVPSWTLVTDYYGNISVIHSASPDFVDIDNDNDFDLFIGNRDGVIHFYRNDGDAYNASWTFITANYNSIDNIDNV